MTFLFTDRHAYLAAAQFFADVKQLGQIDWPILRQRNFKKSADKLDRFERYQAEVLVHKHLPVHALTGIVCYNDSVGSDLKAHLTERCLNVPIAAKPGWYF